MDDQTTIQGIWSLVSGERKGVPFPDEIVKHVKLVFSTDTLTTQTKDRKSEVCYKLEPSKDPKEIDVLMEGSVGKGIYDLSGDLLKIVHGEVGDERPKQFPTAGSGLTVMVLKRETPE